MDFAVKRHDQDLILRPKLINKRYRRRLYLSDLKFRRVAHVEDQSDRKRLMLIRKQVDLLLFAVLKYFEIFLYQPADKAAFFVHHANRNGDELRIHPDDLIISGNDDRIERIDRRCRYGQFCRAFVFFALVFDFRPARLRENIGGADDQQK